MEHAGSLWGRVHVEYPQRTACARLSLSHRDLVVADSSPAATPGEAKLKREENGGSGAKQKALRERGQG